MAVAASEGDLEKVDELIACGANPNAVGEHGVTVIGWLLYRPNIAGLKRLFEHGADPNAIWDKWDIQRGWEWSFMHLATELSPNIGVEYLQLALDMGGDPNLMINNYYKFPILLTMEPEFKNAFEELYNSGAKLNYDIHYTQTPLMRSVTVDNFELCSFLLKHGADYMYGAPFDWAEKYAKEHGISSPKSALWSRLLHDILNHEPPIKTMWFWRCIDFLENKGMNFAIPADVAALRPKILDTRPTAYELEIERLNEENPDAS